MINAKKGNQKLWIGLILFMIGLLGILSMLTMDVPLPPEAEAILKNKFTPGQIKLLVLINPTILLIVAVVVGSIFYTKVNLSVPVVERLIRSSNNSMGTFELIKYGLVGGVISGILLSLIAFAFEPLLPKDFMELGERLKPTLAARFLYGGLTEEILLRFGLMSFLVWGFSKVLGSLKPMVYWIGIVFAAILFALAHFPIAFQAVEQPSSMLLTYILIGNSMGGIIFGWLYWRKGLESAFLAHIFTHVVMVSAAVVFG